jgi:hypothetical protein
MPSFPGYTLPDELRILAEQIRRFVQEEIIPAEQRVDPDAEELVPDDHKRLSDMTKAAAPVCAFTTFV